jgi:cysteine desulfurase/selenocysteine lyase
MCRRSAATSSPSPATRCAAPPASASSTAAAPCSTNSPPTRPAAAWSCRSPTRQATWKPAPERFEAGTPNVAGAIGLGAACDYLDSIGREKIAAHDAALVRYAMEKLSALPGIRIIGPRRRAERSGLVSFAFENVHAHDIVTFADEDGVALRGGHHCNQPLMRKLGLTSTTRASFYLYNTEQEIDRLVTSLRRIQKFFAG